MSDLKIFTQNIEPQALNQIYTLVKQPAFADCKVRIMPDVHAGAGCVIGFTADLGDKVIPSVVGADIGCGMLTVELGNIDIDPARLDEVIRKYVPSGRNLQETEQTESVSNIISQLYCKDSRKQSDWQKSCFGTLGGGNHFIEVDIDEDNNKYLVIHSGSRNMGKQVAAIYQQMAVDDLSGGNGSEEESRKLSEDGRRTGRHKKNKDKNTQRGRAEPERKIQPKASVPRELSYLTGRHREMYLHDMKLCQEFAKMNRITIADQILTHLSGHSSAWYQAFETVHNYIEHDTNIVRKGAISAKSGETVLIPINMRDGCIIGKGKGNADWNYSAPHGAGRIMSRSKAKETVSLEEFQQSMQGIYTTSVNRSTIDESPMAYKPIEEIIANIQDTVEIVKVIKPIYNFKAGE